MYRDFRLPITPSTMISRHSNPKDKKKAQKQKKGFKIASQLREHEK